MAVIDGELKTHFSVLQYIVVSLAQSVSKQFVSEREIKFSILASLEIIYPTNFISRDDQECITSTLFSLSEWNATVCL